MDICFYVELDEGRRAALSAALSRHTTLEKVVIWGFAQAPLADVSDVIVQDEFTHDVIVPFEDIVLVYDST